MLFLVGLGLGSPEDITLRGLRIVQNAQKVFLESYTSILCQENSLESLVRIEIRITNIENSKERSENRSV